ncbi:Protein of unknown function (DUF4199) [Fodinibius salinus]|uniref:DUF4199 domain-containing protein n=1 Tax=Fodinibius salinus TaxID=860790 RepID=A0A5D3YE96_9BACT|nr:DUF4199 family protein [Fodinibius salinus]TYP91662.1 Protein of unknown function (DUF4199) [Fodinibius salinus]
MDTTEQLNETDNNYWPSVFISGGIFGLIYFLLPVLVGYMIINANPSEAMSSLLITVVGFCLACLIGTLGGFTAAWHYAKEFAGQLDLGKGALIGFITGVIIVVVEVFASQLWSVIDPDYIPKLLENLTTMIGNLNIPEAQKQMQIDSIAGQFQSSDSFGSVFVNLLIQAPIWGLLNLITGMIGAKIFGIDEPEF